MINQILQVHENVKTTLDVVSYTTAAGAIFGLLPPLASLLSIIWLSLQIYEKIVSWKEKKKEEKKDETNI